MFVAAQMNLWEMVHSEKFGGQGACIQRMKVPGGWLYLRTAIHQRAFGREEWRDSMVFVPDKPDSNIQEATALLEAINDLAMEVRNLNAELRDVATELAEKLVQST
jgi:hypothetical protein